MKMIFKNMMTEMFDRPAQPTPTPLQTINKH